MQRTITRAAIKAGKRNDLNGFFTQMKELTKYRDQAMIPGDHSDKITELCDTFKARPDITSD